MQDNYSQIISLMKKVGDPLPTQAGSVSDIGVKKQWLTDQDIAIEKKFQKLIDTFEGEHQIFAEELNQDIKNGENVWVIDPVSHTFAFIHGLPHYAIVVAHQYQGETVFAAAYDPSTKELFSSEKGKGMFLNDKKVEVNKSETDLCFNYDPQMPAHRFSKEDRLDVLSELMGLGRNKTVGSACLLYAYVATGKVHASIDMNKDDFTWIPGKLMVEEAGGSVTDFYGNEVELGTMGIIATNGKLHETVVSITKKY